MDELFRLFQVNKASVCTVKEARYAHAEEEDSIPSSNIETRQARH